MSNQKSTLANSFNNNERNYMVQLDALRAFAVFFVIISHYLPEENYFHSILPWGAIGVNTFFVMSGFLVTSILLSYKQLIKLNNKNPWHLIRKFYFRRLIRILPIYYLTVLITAVLNLGTVRQHLFWHLAYLSNIYTSLYGWLGTESHFWSLAVEMQFYLIWPFIVIFIPEKNIIKSILITILIAPLSRLICLLIGAKIAAITFPTCCLDSLGIGAFLAYHSSSTFSHNIKFDKNLYKYGLWLGLFTLVVSQCIRVVERLGTESFGYEIIIQDTSIALIALWVIASAAKGFGGISGKILEIKYLIYLGKISYGIYLYHNFMYVIILYPRVYNILHIPYPNLLSMQFIYKLLATIFIASLSWQFIEKPINSLKKIVK